jgi:putative phage-type endonuclease
MKVIDCEQGSPEWYAARLGKVTASRMADVVVKTKRGLQDYAASRANYAAELIAERLTGAPAERYTNAAMQWGSDQEPVARGMYEFLTDCSVVMVGAVIHQKIEMSLASPDGLVGDSGLVEIKCPNTATHIETLLGVPINGKYIKQMQWQMACTERAWCDFVSFDPRMPGDMQIHVQRVPRDDELIAELEREAVAFLAEIDDRIARLVAKFRTQEAAE